MSEEVIWLNSWEEVKVKEECTENGCIPASIHWLLSWSQITSYSTFEINLKDFQKKICERIPSEKRSFGSITEYIKKENNISEDLFQIEANFKTGEDKFDRIFELIDSQIGVLISIHSGLKEIKTPNPNGIDLWNIEQDFTIAKRKIEAFLEKFEQKTNQSNSIGLHHYCHIIPVVGISEDNLHIMNVTNGKAKPFSRLYLEFLHDNLLGGNDIFWLKR